MSIRGIDLFIKVRPAAAGRASFEEEEGRWDECGALARGRSERRGTTHNHGFFSVEIRENGGGRRAIDRITWRFWLSLAVYTILRPPEHAIGG